MNLSGFIHGWYEKNLRDLPMRQTRDPYRTWVAEVILQQTRMDQGLPYLHKFLRAFPDVKALASASEDEVLRLWQGLGYYSRARNMHSSARYVLDQLGGEMPGSFNELLKLKGVGKVWQYTACDAATSFGVARLIAGNWSAKKSAVFLEKAVIPAFRTQGFDVQRVLTDCGREYYGAFDKACAVRGIRHTRTKPRHAWTNGFVERLQGTILRELWRVAFRRRFFTSVPQMQRELDGYLRYYNFERLHHGYRTKGRTPGEVIAAHRKQTEVSL